MYIICSTQSSRNFRLPNPSLLDIVNRIRDIREYADAPGYPLRQWDSTGFNWLSTGLNWTQLALNGTELAPNRTQLVSNGIELA